MTEWLSLYFSLATASERMEPFFSLKPLDDAIVSLVPWFPLNRQTFPGDQRQ